MRRIKNIVLILLFPNASALSPNQGAKVDLIFNKFNQKGILLYFKLTFMSAFFVEPGRGFNKLMVTCLQNM